MFARAQTLYLIISLFASFTCAYPMLQILRAYEFLSRILAKATTCFHGANMCKLVYLQC